jgi:hypothetical protein
MESIHALIEDACNIHSAAASLLLPLIGPPCGGRVRGAFRILTASRDWQFGAINRADVADFLVRQIADRTLIGATPVPSENLIRRRFAGMMESRHARGRWLRFSGC